jgi:serine/threonine protein kinase
MPQSPEIDLVPGYNLQRRLGGGGFGEVWQATAPDGAPVALKFINARHQDSALLRGEVRVLRSFAQVNHPNLIKLHDVFARGHYLVLCMELANGNLDELRQAYVLETGGNIPRDHALELVEQAATGLDYLAGLRLPGFNQTAAGMQHCDVKPSNLLLLDDQVKVADFGLCAGLGQCTHRKGVRGTPPFAPPELYQGRVCSQTDQYALAVTWCELVGGSKMVKKSAGTGDSNLLLAIDLSQARGSEVPVLTRALSADPIRRYPNCQTFVAELTKAVKMPSRRLKTLPPTVSRNARGRGNTKSCLKGAPSLAPRNASGDSRPGF